MADEEVKKQAEKVNLESLDASMSEETLELNPDANPMEGPPPISDGIHRVRLVFDQDYGWDQADTKPNKDGESTRYYRCKWYGVVVDPGPDENKRVFSSFGAGSTLAFGGKSEMAYILKMIWGNTPEAADAIRAIKSPVELAQTFQKTLAGEPIIRVETKWTATYANPNKSEKKKYLTALSGQRNFPAVDPKDASKGRRPVTNVNGVGEVVARSEVQDYFPDTN